MIRQQLLWITIAGILTVIYTAAFAGSPDNIRIAQGEKEFSCDVFGSGFTPHPDFPYTCCKPGLVPVRGEVRCAAPGDQTNVRDNPQPQGSGSPEPCIAKGSACILYGTPCCAGSCSGKFPITTCR